MQTQWPQSTQTGDHKSSKIVLTQHIFATTKGHYRISDYIKRYATEDALRDNEASSSSASEMSELSEDEAQDMEL